MGSDSRALDPSSLVFRPCLSDWHSWKSTWMSNRHFKLTCKTEVLTSSTCFCHCFFQCGRFSNCSGQNFLHLQSCSNSNAKPLNLGLNHFLAKQLLDWDSICSRQLLHCHLLKVNSWHKCLKKLRLELLMQLSKWTCNYTTTSIATTWWKPLLSLAWILMTS